MLDRLTTEMMKESAEEIFKLHELAWEKTFHLITFCMNERSEEKILDLTNQYNVELQYSGAKPAITYKHYQPTAPNLDKPDVYEGIRDTRELVADVELLEFEDEYYSDVRTIMKKIEVKLSDIQKLTFDTILYILTGKHIRSLNEQIKISLPTEGIYTTKNHNSTWLVYNAEKLYILNKGNLIESFSQHIGDRVGIGAGEISYCCFYPITTLLGSVCSIFIGFKSGIIMKYNLNKNPVKETQTNLSFFNPLIQHIRTGE
jgi:hypothetical protein